MDWTDSAIHSLRLLWGQTEPQLSAAEIARKMGTSKNAIVGKAHRLGLPRRPSPINMTLAAPKPLIRPKVTLPTAATEFRVPPKMLNSGQLSILARTASRPALPTDPALAEFSRPTGGLAAVKTTLAAVFQAPEPNAPPAHRTCRFPLWGDDRPKPGKHRFCDAPVTARRDGSWSSWCTHHLAVCTTSHAAYGYAEPAMPGKAA